MWRAILAVVCGLVAWAVVVTLLNFGLRAAIPGLSRCRSDTAVHAGDEDGTAGRSGVELHRRRNGGRLDRALEQMGAVGWQA